MVSVDIRIENQNGKKERGWASGGKGVWFGGILGDARIELLVS